MVQLQRVAPILIPTKDYQSKFNAGMIEANGEIHLLYRLTEKRASGMAETLIGIK